MVGCYEMFWVGCMWLIVMKCLYNVVYVGGCEGSGFGVGRWARPILTIYICIYIYIYICYGAWQRGFWDGFGSRGWIHVDVTGKFEVIRWGFSRYPLVNVYKKIWFSLHHP